MGIRELFKKKEAPARCSAVIVAAGSSQRMGSDKMMASLGGIPVVVRTLQAFQRSEYVDEIVVVTQTEKIEQLAELCVKYEITKTSRVISGGATRMESALAGVSEVRRGAKLIAIHDGARPLVPQELIERVVNAARSFRSAVPALKSVDTLKIVDGDGIITGAADREYTVRVQTPQVFDADLIKGALTKAVTSKLSLTDDCSAVEMMGIKTHTVPGDENNIKITNPRDLYVAEGILKDRGGKL